MKEPLPLVPRQGKSKLALMGQLLQDCMVVNATLFAVAIALTPNFRTAGSNSSSHLDARTGRPLLQQLAGCEVVAPTR